MFSWLFRHSSKAPVIDRDSALKARPLKNPHVEAEEKGEALVLSYPLKPSRSLRLLGWFMKKFGPGAPPPRRRIELDAAGSHVWRMCDGHCRVCEIVQSVAKKYRLPKHEAEYSTVLFLKMLASRGLIALVVEQAGQKALEVQCKTGAGGRRE